MDLYQRSEQEIRESTEKIQAARHNLHRVGCRYCALAHYRTMLAEVKAS